MHQLDQLRGRWLLQQELVERWADPGGDWNGTSWSITPSPDPNQGSNAGLGRVSCTSSTNCVAVGAYNNSSSVEQTLAETWNGTSWSIVSSPNEGSGQNALTDVSCTSSTICVAVGFYVNSSSVQQTLAETWNGTSWSTVSSPNEGSGPNELDGVSCTSSTNCVAVGFYTAVIVVNPDFPPINVIQTLVETWNGTSWSIISSPNAGSDELNQLLGVSCSSSTSCVAVGFWAVGTTQTLIEAWNGTSWSLTPSPGFQGNYDTLSDVSCTSSTICVAVGYDETSANPVLQKTLIETTGAAPPVVTAQSTDQSVGAGGTVIFTAAASGNPSPTVQWQNSTDGGSTWSDISGATSTTYTITSVTSSDIGNEFRAVFTNANGSATTNAATLDPPTTSVLIPSNGTTLSGSTYLDAAASNATSVKFLLFGGIYGYNAPVLCTATPTEYGWLCSWNTSTAPNGSYVLVSQAFNASGNSYSSGVGITISNPTTSVLIPKSGATLSGSTTLDASASNATGVDFLLFGGSYGYNAPVLCGATATSTDGCAVGTVRACPTVRMSWCPRPPTQPRVRTARGSASQCTTDRPLLSVRPSTRLLAWSNCRTVISGRSPGLLRVRRTVGLHPGKRTDCSFSAPIWGEEGTPRLGNVPLSWGLRGDSNS